MMIFTYPNYKPKKSKMTKADKNQLNEYNDWRSSNKLPRVASLKAEAYTRKFKEYKPKTSDYRTTEHIKSVESNGLAVCGRSSIMDPINLNREPEHVREAILAKSKRIAQMYNKGGYQYITDDIDVKTIGTRNRRM
jgi:hypothetical protein